MELALQIVELVLLVLIAGGLAFVLPVVLRIRTLLRELLQSIVGKVEEGTPFIHGMGPPDGSMDPTALADTIVEAERDGLDNGTFRGKMPWEPPSDETKA